MKAIYATSSEVLLAGALTDCAKGKVSDDKGIRETANAIFTAFAEQDAGALDRHIPDSSMNSFVYNDQEGFKMYTSRMSWGIIDVKEEMEGKDGGGADAGCDTGTDSRSWDPHARVHTSFKKDRKRISDGAGQF